jgi:hypothetical protein
MRTQFVSEAANCRAQAKHYIGRPEESFLLRAAREFEALAQGTDHHRKAARAGVQS